MWTPCKRLKEIISPRDSKWSGEAQSDYFLELSLRAASFQPSFASCAALPNFLPTTRPALSTSTAALCAACPTLPAGVFASSRRCWGDGLGPQAHSEMKHATKTGRMLFRLLLECMGAVYKRGKKTSVCTIPTARCWPPSRFASYKRVAGRACRFRWRTRIVEAARPHSHLAGVPKKQARQLNRPCTWH